MKKLYHFYWDCGRSGELEGLFLATQEEIDEAIGREVYFGEVLGKHSEIYACLEPGHIKMLCDDSKKIAVIESIFKSDVLCGRSPLDYIEDDEDEEK